MWFLSRLNLISTWRLAGHSSVFSSERISDWWILEIIVMPYSLLKTRQQKLPMFLWGLIPSSNWRVNCFCTYWCVFCCEQCGCLQVWPHTATDLITVTCLLLLISQIQQSFSLRWPLYLTFLVKLNLPVIIPFLVDALKCQKWLYLLDWLAFTIRLSVQPVILDDSLVSEHHVSPGMACRKVAFRCGQLLDCHKQLLNNNNLFIGKKRKRTTLESCKQFWRQKIQISMSGVITL